MVGMLPGSAGPRAPGPKYGQAIAPNLNVRQLCPNCRHDPPNIIEEYSKGDLVCGDCGTILGDRIVDTRSEWRTFAGDEGGDDPSRVGEASNPLLGNFFETSISSQDGRTGMSRDLQRAQARVSAQNNGATTAAALQAIFTKIAEKCEVMNLPRNVISRAQHVYKIADDRRLIRGTRNEMPFIAAAIIFAGRNVGAERSYAEVCKVTHVHRKDLHQAITALKRVVVTQNVDKSAGMSSTQKSVEGLLARFTNYLDLGNTIHNAAKHIAVQAIAKAEVEGRNPVSIAAGILFFACVLFEHDLPAKEIVQVAGMTESTIKHITKIISAKLDDVIRPEWKTEHPAGYASLASMSHAAESLRPSRSGTPRGGTPRAGTPNPAGTTSKPEEGQGEKQDGNGDGSGSLNGDGKVNGETSPAATATTNGVATSET